MFIVCKIKLDGKLLAAAMPAVHETRELAILEAERLAASQTDALGFYVFQAFSRSERAVAPVATTIL